MHSGSCLCEAIEYTVDDELETVVNCHCQFCRKAHGAEFVPVAMISDDKLKIEHGQELLSKFAVANGAAFRCFCSACGTRLFNHSPAANFISVVTATITSSADLAPLANVNMESSNKKFQQNNGLPKFETFPNLAELKK